MTQQWGRPLTGDQMKWARLRDIAISTTRLDENNEWRFHLPTDHIAYQVLDHNEKHGTNFVPWYGGDSAPADWDGGDVLVADTHLRIVNDPNKHSWSGAYHRALIIGYTPKQEACHPPAVDGDTVTIPRMSNEEWDKLRHADLSLQAWAHRVGLIKPEPTREERFWQETGADKSAFSPVALDLVSKALEFER